jgi:hypothetical protein
LPLPHAITTLVAIGSEVVDRRPAAARSRGPLR